MDLETVDGRTLTVCIHDAPHLDEAAAVWLMQDFAWEPGKLDELLAHFPDGVITIGCNSGPLDEHTIDAGKRPPNICAASLTARWIGGAVIDDRAAMDVVNAVMEFDTKGRTRDITIAGVGSGMKGLNRLDNRYTPWEIVQFAVMACQSRFGARQSFYATAEEIEEKGHILTYPSGDSPEPDFKLLVIVSDNTAIANYAFGEMGIAVVIQQEANGDLKGNTQIFTNAVFRVDMDDVAQNLRRVEQLFFLNHTGSIPVTGWDELREDGMFPVPDKPEHERISGMAGWYFMRNARMMLNGSESHPEVPPTKIPLDTIAEIVIQCLDPTQVDPERGDRCREGGCPSTTSNPCPLYPLGLKRCRTARYHKRAGNGQ
ncbi:hypothetical protein KKI23_00325 [Patescibacteria group bacterium]|nr:hypothetical protein [Patescibacteria group bacterium]